MVSGLNLPGSHSQVDEATRLGHIYATTELHAGLVCLNSGRRMELLVDRRSCIAELLFAAVIGPGNSYRNNALLRV